VVAARTAAAAPAAAAGSALQLTLADSNYDAARSTRPWTLTATVAMHCWRRCAASSSSVPRAGTPRRCANGPQRRAALALWQQHPDLVRYVMEQRNNAEGVFSVLAMVLGLHALPSFVRSIHRVRPWIGAKIILYHARLLAQERAAELAAA